MFTQNPVRRIRKEASNLHEAAIKVLRYRRDLIGEAAARKIEERVRNLNEAVAAFGKSSAGGDQERFKAAMAALDRDLRKYGGRLYPKTFFSENVEVVLVTAIVVLAIRAFFFQPFIIPTNSMFPSYYGMTFDVAVAEEEVPAVWTRPFRFLLQGARDQVARAPESGEIRIPFDPDRGFVFSVNPSRKWLVLPAQVKHYRLHVGNSAVGIDVPLDFSFEEVIFEAFFSEEFSDLREAVRGASREGRIRPGPDGQIYLFTGKTVEQGDPVVAFTRYSGDALFVDRMRYHFVRPSIGDPFVFRTDEIPQVGEDKYYIKRLVGHGGDRLSIQPPYLYRNGEPIEGAPAFEKNFARVDGFGGYAFFHQMQPGVEILIPDEHFYALGDNSLNSRDSRDFGPFPESAVIGRALFIYYPFTRRWGPAR